MINEKYKAMLGEKSVIRMISERAAARRAEIGGEMKQIVESAEVLTSEGEVLNLTNEELGMGYRTSVIAKNDYVALSAVLKLEKGDRQEIRAYMEDLKERRVTKQPLEFGSAGSTFKRPEGYFAGKLIQDSGDRKSVV